MDGRFPQRGQPKTSRRPLRSDEKLFLKRGSAKSHLGSAEKLFPFIDQLNKLYQLYEQFCIAK
jgi:hypothetical protein